jgi:hypothetical protein
MSWLSSALKNNSVKIGLAIAGAYFGGKYLYGTTGFKGTDPTNPFDYSGVYDTAGNVMQQTYVGDSFGERALGFLNVPAFKDTAIGKSFVGDAVEFMRPGGGAGQLLGALASNRQNKPPDIRLADTGGYGVQGSGSGIAAGQAQMINLGRGGALQQALGRADTQMYLARKVKGLGLPPIAQLPAASGITSTGIRTTSMQSRAYKKLGLTKS